MGMIILMAACAAFVFVDVLQVPYRFPILKRKPFNCKTCMSGWLVLPLLLLYPHPWYEVPYLMAVAMVGSIFLNGVIHLID